ncbi:inter-alpha-trypsin inhibitor heavy chain H4 isoform 2-T2 [Aphomia sociella]
MKTRWPSVLVCLCIWAATTESAAVPTQTQDTMVVAKLEDAHTEASTALSNDETSTAEPIPPVKLTEMDVTSNIALRYAHTAVVTRVRNPAKRAQETTFKILLPETAFISGFIMTLDGKSYKAYVKEKEEAKNIYNEAVASGAGAAHIAAKARDSNQFTVTVNVEPNTEAVFNLTYEELLSRRNGVYNHAINLHPGSLVPNLSVTVNIHEAQKITVLRVPEVRTGNEIDATAEDTQNSKAVITRDHDDRVATVTFKPDLEEQRRLIGIYMERSKESRANMERHTYYYNRIEEGSNTEESPEGVLGQFVVQYDVDRPKNGEILVNNGYFVHFFAPADLPPLNKHVVFVLDTSGSMSDRKIVQLQEAMQTILSDLNKGDYFNIVEFDSYVTVHELKEADEEPAVHEPFYYRHNYATKAKLISPSPATPENIAKAKVIVNRLEATGGTNIAEALDVAVKIVQKGLKANEPNNTAEPPKHETLPDALPANKTESTTLPATKPTEENKADREAAIKLEPIIIFLTDGDPTVGETNPTKIINRLTEKNYGENKATIFSLAFGQDADRKFLRKISLRNEGFMRHIYEAADAAQQLRDFYRQVSSPLLAHVKFVYPPNQVKADSLTKHRFRTYYDGSEVVVAGQIDESASEITPELHAFCGNPNEPGQIPYDVMLKVPVAQKRDFYLPLERLWAYLQVKQLLDDKDALAESEKSEDKANSPEKKALNIALKYELVTPLTSLVVVKPNATKDAVNAESVDKVDDGGHHFGGAPLSALYSSGGFSTPVGLASFASAPQAGLALGAFVQDKAAFVQDYKITAYDPIRLDEPLADIVEEADYDFDRPVAAQGFGASNGGYPGLPMAASYMPSTQLIIMPTLSTVLPHINPLHKYHLEAYTWATPLLNSTTDSLQVEVNGTVLNMKLATDNTIPKSPSGDPDCNNAVDGTNGVCVYLLRCVAAQSITTEKYSHSACVVDTGYAGVCCPNDPVKVNKTV